MKLHSASWLLVGSLAGGLLVACGGSGADGGDGDSTQDGDGDSESIDDECQTDADCDDGLTCNGEEICDRGLCEDGEAIDCSAEGCGGCDEETGECVAADKDGDGHGDMRCGGDDCDDEDAERFPGNEEVCDENGVDEDCDYSTFGEKDSDGDGAIDEACTNTNDNGDVVGGNDCDDNDLAVRRGIPEFCDNVDNDCDGEIDEEVGAVTWYADHDGDGFGGLNAPTKTSCVQPYSYSLYATDCDDDDIQVHPAQLEVCDDGINNDCDDRLDEGPLCENPEGEPVEKEEPLPDYEIPDCTTNDHCDDFIACTTDTCNDGKCENLPPDVDGDGHFDETCLDLNGAPLGDDCDDDEAKRYTGAEERCDTIDNDCNDTVDDIASGTCCVSDSECDDSDPYTLGDSCDWDSPMAQVNGCIPGTALELDCRGIDAAYLRVDSSGVPYEEVVMLEDEQWSRTRTDPYGNSWPSAWTKARNNEVWQSTGLRPESGEFFAMDVSQVPGDTALQRMSFAGDQRFTMVENGVDWWPSTWTSESMTDLWGGAGGTPPPTTGIDAYWHTPRYNGGGIHVAWEERFFVGANSYYRHSTDVGASSWGTYTEQTLSSFFGAGALVPPSTGIDAAFTQEVLDNSGSRVALRQVIYRGTARFSRESTNHGGTWGDWQVETLEDYWGGDTDAPPTSCTPWEPPPLCPPDPNAGTEDSPLSGADSTCYTGDTRRLYASFDDDSLVGDPLRYHFSFWYQPSITYLNRLLQITGATSDTYAAHDYLTGQTGIVKEALSVSPGNPSLNMLPYETMCAQGTMSVWVKLDAYPATGSAGVMRTPRLTGPSPTQSLAAITVSSAQTVSLTVDSTPKTVSSFDVIPLNEWVHLAAVTVLVPPPGGVGDGEMEGRLYMNGKLVATTPMDVSDSCAIWDAGAHSVILAEELDGSLDEAAYFQSGLSEKDVYRLYLMGLDGRKISDTYTLYYRP